MTETPPARPSAPLGAGSLGPAHCPAGCPACGARLPTGALFCEQCGAAVRDPAQAAGPTPQAGAGPATPGTAAVGDESPLDTGWTALPGGATEPAGPDTVPTECVSCGQGRYVDGYCDQCGSKAPNPRDHFVEDPAPWVGGVCDIGRRHERNEDAMALAAQQQQLSFAALVVCDGVSRSTDSHIASLAASRAAREVLVQPLPRAVGTPGSVQAGLAHRLGEAVEAGRRAVIATTADRRVESPPSCTFVAVLIDDGVAVAGNVGDSRAYWLPDDPAAVARQLTEDDSFAAEQVRNGIPREQAESGPQAHAITRWLGIDAPADLTPNTASIVLDHDGWLMVCSDGLWNYCSAATDLRDLVVATTAALRSTGQMVTPVALAQALIDFANASGGVDNITVTLARVGALPRPEPAVTEHQMTSGPADTVGATIGATIGAASPPAEGV